MAKRQKPTDTFDFDAPGDGGASGNGSGEGAVPLHEAAQSRYLNYALSVITSPTTLAHFRCLASAVRFCCHIV